MENTQSSKPQVIEVFVVDAGNGYTIYEDREQAINVLLPHHYITSHFLDEGTLAVPTYVDFLKFVSASKDESDANLAYRDFKDTYSREYGVTLEDWWEKNKRRYVVDVDGAMDKLREMIG